MISIVCKHPRMVSVLACKASPAIISARCVRPVLVVCVVSVFIGCFLFLGWLLCLLM